MMSYQTDPNIRKRLKWIKLYEQIGNLGTVCLKCGISRPTLRKWVQRYKKDGISGLVENSRRPKRSPRAKVDSNLEKTILQMRHERKLGARRLQNELIRSHSTKLSLATIHKVLKFSKTPILKRKIQGRKVVHRYQRSVPGERVQMDVCKIAPRIYQYTAIDDCTRYRVLAIYKRRTAENTLKFLDKVMEETPFPIQRIQTDRGKEFFAYKVQETLMNWGIKFRPIKPRSPHLNGKV